MGTLKNVAFQSLRSLREWRKNSDGSEFEDEWVNNVLMPGMETHFKSEKPVIRVWDHTVMDSNTDYVDVHFELEGIDGVGYQPWLISFITPKRAEEEKQRCRDRAMEIPNYYRLSELPSPFPPSDIVWECDHFTPEIVIEAVEAWCETCWPDFEATFRYEMAEDGMSWLRDVISDALDAGDFECLPEAHEDELKRFKDSEIYLVGPPEHLTKDLLEWLAMNGHDPLYETTDGIIIQCLPSFPSSLQEKWPQISCKLAFQK